MRSSTAFFYVLAAVVAVLADPIDSSMVDLGCGHARWQNLTSKAPTAALQRRSRFGAPRDVGSHIKVYWEVVAKDNTLVGGYLSDEHVRRQIEVLNRDFEPVGLSFELAEIKRKINPSWATISLPVGNNPDYSPEIEMKNSVLMRDPATLRVYSNVNPPHQGWAFVPKDGPVGAELDGVVLWAGMLPHDRHPGHELTHEVGHWSGLDHTFNNGCDGSGDYVSDTPPQRDPTNQCTTPRYSCGRAFPDAADNYMNYVPDECRTKFTIGQIERMRTHLQQYRGVRIRAPRKAVPSSPTPFQPTTDNRWSNRRPTTQVTLYRPATPGRRPSTRYWYTQRPTYNQRPSTPNTSPSTPHRPTTPQRPSTPNTRTSTPQRPNTPQRPTTRWQSGTRTRLIPLPPGTPVGPEDKVHCWGNNCYLVKVYPLK